MTRDVTCPYCGASAELVGGDVIYPHRRDLRDRDFWRCAPCCAYVGCHRGTTKPLGRLADAELRRAKIAAHSAFDPLWRGGQMRRKQAYKWLAGALGIAPKDCHVGMFDVGTCTRIVRLCEEREESHAAPLRRKAPMYEAKGERAPRKIGSDEAPVVELLTRDPGNRDLDGLVGWLCARGTAGPIGLSKERRCFLFGMKRTVSAEVAAR